MTPEELALAIRGALLDSIDSGALALDPQAVPETVKVERPRNRDHGDWATNVAMQLAKRAGMNPRDFAALLAEELREHDGIDGVDVAGPGFINIRLAAASAGELARTIVEAGDTYGSNDQQIGRAHV